MKKGILLVLLAVFLVGCGAQETIETVDDIIPVEPVASPQQFFVSLPDEAAAPTFQDDSQELYVCRIIPSPSRLSPAEISRKR